MQPALAKLPDGVPPAPAVHLRSHGEGPPVLCLHANAGNSGQWRVLMESLAPRGYRVLASDGYGAGRSPPWPAGLLGRPLCLHDEVALIAPVLAQQDTPVVLVGHSYGAAVALRAALEHPQRVRALVLYEPTLFALVDAATPPPNDADGIRAVVDAAGRAVQAGDLDAAAQCFIDYWIHPGAWRAMPPARRVPIAQAMRDVRGWGHALFDEPTPLEAFARLAMPTLLLVGACSPASSRAVARLLCGVLPHLQLHEFAALGHMGPVTDAALVNERIVQFVVSDLEPVQR